MAFLIDPIWKQGRLILGNEEIYRRMSFAGRWQRIRIGIRGCIIGGYTGIWQASMALGVFNSSGIGGGFMADRSEALITMPTGVSYPANMTLANTGGNLYARWTGATAFRRLNNVITQSNTASTAQFFSAMTAIHSVYIVDIVKAAANWTAAATAPSSSANALTDKSYAQFLNDVARTDAVPTGYAGLSATVVAPGSAYTNKVLDTVSFAWTSSTLRFQLQNIVVVRIT